MPVKFFLKSIADTLGYTIQKKEFNHLGLDKDRIKSLPYLQHVSEDIIASKYFDQAFMHQLKLLPYGKVHTIFDVGAFDGNISALYTSLYPMAKVFSFEPFPSSFSRLQALSAGNDRIAAHPFALSDLTGTEVFYVTNSEASSSLLPVNTEHIITGLENHIQVKSKLTVSTTTIDEFCKEERIEKIDILKLDVQGAELKVLQGAKQALNNRTISLIYTEVEFSEIYNSQPLFHDISKYLFSYGYSLYNFFNLRYNDGKLLWGDAIFLSPNV